MLIILPMHRCKRLSMKTKDGEKLKYAIDCVMTTNRIFEENNYMINIMSYVIRGMELTW